MLIALVPFNSLARAKQRLTTVLDDQQRRQLVAAMLEDTLTALARNAHIDRVLLVSDDDFAQQLAARLDIEWHAEPMNASGLNAVVQACAESLVDHCTSLLLVHGDLPLLTDAELDSLITKHHMNNAERKITLVPDAVQDGSNCLLCSPANVLPFNYGKGSFEKHLEIARQAGIQSMVLALDGAGLDIDEPADIAALAEHPLLANATRTSSIIPLLDVTVSSLRGA